MSKLKIAEDLSLPLDAVTESIAILAKRRAGKSTTARRLAEQLHKAKQQVVIVDPKGDWWGLLFARDGKSPGLPFVILGGEHGHIRPLEVGAGELVAKMVVMERVSLVLDLSEFRKHEVSSFMIAFMENLYRLKAKEEYRTPLMLIIDEADAIAPQKPQKLAGSKFGEGEERMVGAASDLVRRGGQRGIGVTMITQRSAVLSKDLLTQIGILIVLRTIAPQDIEAIDAWVDVHGTPEERKELMASLPSLPTGTGWVWAPGWPDEAGIFQKSAFLLPETFDSSATPDQQKKIQPKNAADVDLQAFRREMAATIEKAKADDPRELKKQISDLKGQNTNWEKRFKNWKPEPSTEAPASKRDIERAGKIAELKQSLAQHQRALEDAMKILVKIKAVDFSARGGEALEQAVTAAVKQITGSIEKRVNALAERVQGIQAAAASAEESITKLLNEHIDLTVTVQKQAPYKTSAPQPVIREHKPSAESNGNGNGLVRGGKFRSMLIALAQANQPLADSQLTARAGMALSGTFDKYLGQMRTEGWVSGDRNGLSITQDGLTALGHYDPLPTGDALQDYWLTKLGNGKKREMLAALISAYPRTLSDEQIAEQAQMALSGTFDKYLGQLRSLMLVEGSRSALKASEELFA